ncbi:MAG: hypothetical protein L6243_06115 [Candidatus Altiarchaeales archaeon]|nr:hypothetical protein [Candidatus Altiarchaeota archaeon]MCG2783148.1 hypothetical protein [Candidatus Altiarchaeales archaeon]
MGLTARTLTEKDLEKLKEIQKSIDSNTACLYDKQKCLEYMDSVLNPKCAVCRKPLEGEIDIVRGRKMHPSCRKRYKG